MVGPRKAKMKQWVVSKSAHNGFRTNHAEIPAAEERIIYWDITNGVIYVQ